VRLVLASRSPRRADLLRAAGFAFDVDPAEIDESVMPGETASAYVERLAILKAREVAGRRAEDLVLGADTAVVVDGDILGKPVDVLEARSMLRRLAGRAHEVVTGVAVCRGAELRATVERSLVHFTPLSEDDLTWYVSSGEPFDKAGGYGIQGLASRFADRIEGSYTNVVGLPVGLTVGLLRSFVALRTLDAPVERDVSDGHARNNEPD
jgi:septum formation protein